MISQPLTRRAILSRGITLSAGAGFALLSASACTVGDPVAINNQRAEIAQGDDVLPPESAPTPAPAGPQILSGSFVSARMGGRPTQWAVTRPVGATGTLPVVVVLHALNTNERTIFDQPLAIGQMLQSYVDAGNPPFAIAAVDGARNYWHRRIDGTDGAAMVVEEFLPMLSTNTELNLTTGRIGLFGWSMGGYGALRVGSILGPQRVSSIAVSSPALWADPRTFAPRAFDNISDYQQNSLFGMQDAFRRIPLMIAIGTSDQFFTYTRQWAAGLHPPAVFATGPGGHTNSYWRSVLPDQVEFLGRSLHS